MRILFFTQDLTQSIPTSEYFVSVDYRGHVPQGFDATNSWQYVYKDQEIKPAADTKPANKDVVQYNRDHFSDLLNKKLWTNQNIKHVTTVLAIQLSKDQPNGVSWPNSWGDQAYADSKQNLQQLLEKWYRISTMISTAESGDDFLKIRQELDRI
jgi:hypothetical protein